MTDPTDIIVISAAGMFVLGYLIINQVILRLMLLIGTALYVWYYYVVADAPLWPAIWASAATGSANLIGLLGLYLRNSRLTIPRQFRDIYSDFAILPPGDFRKLMLAAQRVSHPAGTHLTRAGEDVETLYYVIKGAVEIEKFGGMFEMQNGSFVGEIAFLTGKHASATTRMAQAGELLQWDVTEIRHRAVRDVRFRLALDAIISLDLANKVAKAGSPGQVEAINSSHEVQMQ